MSCTVSPSPAGSFRNSTPEKDWMRNGQSDPRISTTRQRYNVLVDRSTYPGVYRPDPVGTYHIRMPRSARSGSLGAAAARPASAAGWVVADGVVVDGVVEALSSARSSSE